MGDELAPRPPRLSRVEMTEMVLPNDANPLGNMLGGRVMHWIDIAAGIAAGRHASRPVVTASIDSLDFLHAIKVGQVVNLVANVTWAGRTSMEIMVEVFAEDLLTGRRRLVNTAFCTFVALDENGRPVQVPPVAPETDEERERYRQAEERRKVRMERRARGTAGE